MWNGQIVWEGRTWKTIFDNKIRNIIILTPAIHQRGYGDHSTRQTINNAIILGWNMSIPLCIDACVKTQRVMKKWEAEEKMTFFKNLWIKRTFEIT